MHLFGYIVTGHFDGAEHREDFIPIHSNCSKMNDMMAHKLGVSDLRTEIIPSEPDLVNASGGKR